MGLAEGISRLPGASYGVSFLDTVLPRNPVTGARQLKILPESYEIRLGVPMYEAVVEDEGGEVDPTPGIAKERIDRVNSAFDKLKLHAKRKEL